MSKTWTYTYKQITEAAEAQMLGLVKTRDLMLSVLTDHASRQVVHLNCVGAAHGVYGLWHSVTVGLSTVTGDWSSANKRFRAQVAALREAGEADKPNASE